MIILMHIVLALTSVIVASAASIRPSQKLLTAGYGTVAGTLVSGTYLVVSSHSKLVPACVAGLLYSLAVVPAMLYARRRLATATVSTRR